MNFLTPKMFLLKERIKHLEWLHKCDPSDYMVEFELIELKLDYSNEVAKERRKTFRIVHNDVQSTIPSTLVSTKVV